MKLSLANKNAVLLCAVNYRGRACVTIMTSEIFTSAVIEPEFLLTTTEWWWSGNVSNKLCNRNFFASLNESIAIPIIYIVTCLRSPAAAKWASIKPLRHKALIKGSSRSYFINFSRDASTFKCSVSLHPEAGGRVGGRAAPVVLLPQQTPELIKLIYCIYWPHTTTKSDFALAEMKRIVSLFWALNT